MVIKGIEEEIEIEEYTIITGYKYFGIMVDNKLRIINI